MYINTEIFYNFTDNIRTIAQDSLKMVEIWGYNAAILLILE